MGQFVGCIQGMRAACMALDYPVVSGNVSLYNETNGQAILPTPVIGGVGVVAADSQHMTIGFKAGGQDIVVLGGDAVWLAQSIYMREIHGREDGAPPPLDLDSERRHGTFVAGLIAAQEITACHDIADGGLLVALAEMALAGNFGALRHPLVCSVFPLHGVRSRAHPEP